MKSSNSDLASLKTIWSQINNNNLTGYKYKTQCGQQFVYLRNVLNYIFLQFNIYLNPRLVAVNANTDNTENPSYINLEIIINNFTNSTGISYPNPGAYSNTHLPGNCIAELLAKWFIQYNPKDSSTFPNNWKLNFKNLPSCIIRMSNNIEMSIVQGFDSSNELPNELLNIKFSNVKYYTDDTQSENFTGVNYSDKPSPIFYSSNYSYQAPTSILDYLFTYSLPISFIGAVAYTIISTLQADPSNIIANRNIIIVINLYFGLCGLLSFIVWSNIDTSFMYSGWLSPNLFNINTVKLFYN